MNDTSVPGGAIRAVIFDVDGTLYRSAPVRSGMVRRLLLHAVLQPRRGLRDIRRLRAFRDAQELLRGAPEAPDLDALQVEHARRVCGGTSQDVRNCVDEWMSRRALDLVRAAAMPGLAATLRELRAGGLRLGVFSDYPPDEKLAALGIADLFDAVACAQDRRVGRFKPDPKGLEVVAADLGTTPAETLYVGDRIDVDAEAAARGGFPFVLLGGSGPLDVPVRRIASLSDVVEVVGEV
jgi:HAD superfamily hydrolase (TIGR01509 family)